MVRVRFAGMWLRTVLACAVAGILLAGPIWAGTTGKIAGQVTDRATGQPIPGAAVLIEGMRLGATTDADGRYFIIGVPPGTFDVKASLLGYAPITKAGILVNIDRTTPTDFQLSSSAIEVEGLTVLAPREVIQLDVAGSRSTLDREDVVALPTVSNLASAISVEPGVAGMSIRGGLAEETQLMLNGHTMTDDRYNRFSASSVPLTSVQEVQILTSGFNAEYGNVRSGVINVVTRDDARNVWMNGRVAYVPAQKKHFGPSAYGTGTREWQVYGSEESLTKEYWIDNLSTPLPGDSTRVFLGWIRYIAARRANHADSLARADSLRMLWQHQHRIMEDDYANKPDYNIDISVGGPIPFVDGLSVLYSHRNSQTLYAMASARPAHTDYTEQMTLTYRLGRSAKMSLTGKYSEELGLSDIAEAGTGGTMAIGGFTHGAITKYALYRSSPAENKTLLLGANFSHVLSTRTQYELGLDYQRNNYQIGQWPSRYLAAVAGRVPINPVWSDQTLTPGDTVGVWKVFATSDPYGVAPWGAQIGTAMETLVKDQRSGLAYDFGSGGQHVDSSWYTGVKVRGSMVSQVTPNHQLKVGFELQQSNFHERRVLYFGDAPSEYRCWYDKSPIKASAYFQDKVEYEGMIMNAGFRVDYLDPKSNAYSRADPFGTVGLGNSIWSKQSWNLNPTWLFYENFDTNATVKGYTVDPAFKSTRISPRLAISHPLDAHSKVYFNYGHFYNYPLTQNLYSYAIGRAGTGLQPPPNPDLEMPRTIMYELAFEREFSNSVYAGLLGLRPEPQFLVRVAGYYKDVVKEVGPVDYFYTFTDHGPQYRNNRYAQVRGFELRASKRVGNFFTGWFQGQLSLRDAGAVGLLWDDPQDNQDLPQQAYQVVSLAEPSWSFFADLHTPRRFSVFGAPPALTELWSLSFLMSYAKGQQAVYNPANLVPAPAPNVRYKDSYGTSMRLAKGVSFGKATGEIYLDVSNVFNYKSLWSGSMSGVEWGQYLASLHFPIEDTAIESDYGNDRIGDTPSYAVIANHDSWAHYLSPRTYSVGFNLSF
jgi:hypothetical protein